MRQVASGQQVQRESLESLALPVPLGRRVQLGPRDRKARRVFPAWRVLLVPRVPPARRGRRVPAEQRETQG